MRRARVPPRVDRGDACSWLFSQSTRSCIPAHDQICEFAKAFGAFVKDLKSEVRFEALLFRHLSGPFDSVNGRKCDFLLLRVLAGGFAQRLRRLLDVQHVIDNLERETDVFAEPRKRAKLLLCRTRIDGAHPDAGSEKRAGLGAVNGIEQMGSWKLPF